jgi:hypothetical protein
MFRCVVNWAIFCPIHHTTFKFFELVITYPIFTLIYLNYLTPEDGELRYGDPQRSQNLPFLSVLTWDKIIKFSQAEIRREYLIPVLSEG